MTTKYDHTGDDFSGHLANTVVKDGSGTEYFVTKVNPKNLTVLSLVDGRPLTGPHRLLNFVRVMAPVDLRRRYALEGQWAENPENPYRVTAKDAEKAAAKAAAAAALPKLGLGMRVRLNKRIGDFGTDIEYVVIGINAKTFNIVPLGGYGKGTEYARASRGYLTLVAEEDGK